MAKTKREIVKLLLNQELDQDDDAIMDILVDKTVVVDVDKQVDMAETFGDRIADKVTAVAGSWTFIIAFLLTILVWIGINVYFLKGGFDPYPFILLNLILSCVAALQAPIIMMSQNRQSEKDRMRGQNDYRVDLKAELILEDLHQRTELILKTQRELIRQINEIKNNNNPDVEVVVVNESKEK